MTPETFKEIMSDIATYILCGVAGFILGVGVISSSEGTVYVNKDTGALVTEYKDKLYKLVPLNP